MKVIQARKMTFFILSSRLNFQGLWSMKINFQRSVLYYSTLDESFKKLKAQNQTLMEAALRPFTKIIIGYTN